MRPLTHLVRLVSVGALVLAIGACGDDDDDTGPTGSEDLPATTEVDDGRNVNLTATLRGGDEEVPNPGDPDGSGSAQVTVKRTEICYELSVTTITLPAAAAHIHRGAAGESGDIVVTLGTPDAEGKASGCVQVPETLLAEIGAGPNDFYVNVHTSDFPGGAVRGQLTV